MRSKPVLQDAQLHEHLGVRPTFDYATALVGPRHADAILSENWGFVRREAAAVAGARADRDAVEPPFDHHALEREGRRTWVHPEASGCRVVIGRVFRARELAYEESTDVELVAATGLRGVPILLVAVAPGDDGLCQAREIEAAGAGAVKLRWLSLQDFRGVFSHSQDPSMRRLGEGFAHPLLPVPVATPRSLPVSA